MAKELIYLDYAASAPVRPEAAQASDLVARQAWGNPASIHGAGRVAVEVVDRARADVAKVLCCEPSEVVFTSGGTEADNLAILGLASTLHKGHIVTTALEHKAVLESCKQLEKWGWRVSYVRPNKDGIVTTALIEAAITDQTRLVSVMYANNEIGTVQPIREIGKMIESRNLNRKNRIWFHTDAVQAAILLDLNTKHLHVDMLTISAHKVGGMKGSGCLFVSKSLPSFATIVGGGQESGRRSGTPNVSGIAAMAAALEMTAKNREAENRRLLGLQSWLVGEIKNLPGVVVNGSLSHRLASNINISVRKHTSDELVIALDREGIAVSAASACASGSIQRSYVIDALGQSDWRATHSLRISMGYGTKKKELVTFLTKLRKLV